jgi:5-methyltetrahydrofolate--homocysteine methyltransferase
LEGSYLSIVTALLCVSSVVLLSTLNLLATLYVAATVCGVLLLVVGTVVGMGWELGFLEGICFAILIGLSYANPRPQSPCPSPGPSLRKEPQESLP